MTPALFASSFILSPLPDEWALRPRRPEDVPAVIELMKRVYVQPHGPEAVWPAETLMQHFEYFPEGQLCIINGQGRLVADSTSMMVSQQTAMMPHRWTDITGQGSLAPHDPRGDVLYGVDLAVDPDFQGMGLARHLYAARHALALRMGCQYFVAGARIPGYHLVADVVSPVVYADLVSREVIYDPTLSMQLRIGFRMVGVFHNYILDPESLDHAVHLVMDL